MEHQDDLVMVPIPSPPVWKTIGEASASLDANGLWIEKVDGFRVAVRRHFGMSPNDDNPFRTQEDLLDMENQNRILRIRIIS